MWWYSLKQHSTVNGVKNIESRELQPLLSTALNFKFNALKECTWQNTIIIVSKD